MQPQQPTMPNPPQQPLNTNQYDFINNNQQQPKSKFSFGGGMSGKLKMVGIGLGVFVLLMVIFTLLFSGGGGDVDPLLKIAKEQSKVIAIAEIGADKAGGVQAQSIAYNSLLSVTSQQNDVVTLITRNGKKIKPKDYTLAADSASVKDLSQAETNGRFDEVFLTTLKTTLENYQKNLSTNFKDLNGPTAKQSLQNANESVNLLIESITL